MDLLVQQMAELGRQNAVLLAEVQKLQHENQRLRRELDAAAGRQVHQPYGCVTVAAGEAASSLAAAGLAAPGSPRCVDMGDHEMEANSPPPKVILKRATAEGENLHPNA